MTCIYFCVSYGEPNNGEPNNGEPKNGEIIPKIKPAK